MFICGKEQHKRGEIMNVSYLKFGENKVYLTETNGVNAEEHKLELTIKAEDNTFEDIKYSFSDLDNVTIYTAIVQEDDRETDEIVQQYFDNFTKLDKLSYNLDSDTYTVTLVVPNEIEARLAELEDAVNFMLMGGDE